MEVAFLGDTHANTGPTLQAIDKIAEKGVDTIIQVGDFGFWPRMPPGEKFLRKVSRRCVQHGITFHWVDGNHEDHSKLPHYQNDPWEHHPNVVWHPRGTVSEIGGRKFLWFGGAVSVDKYFRTPSWDWFETEFPSQDEWDRALFAGKVDVLITHDSPDGIQLKGLPSIPAELERASQNMRFGISAIVEETQPHLIVHGHWHQRLTTSFQDRLVLSLAHDDAPMRDRGLIFELDSLDKWPSGRLKMADVRYLD